MKNIRKLRYSVVLPLLLTTLAVPFNASATTEIGAFIADSIENGDTATLNTLLSELNSKLLIVCENETPLCDEYSAYVSNITTALGEQ